MINSVQISKFIGLIISETVIVLSGCATRYVDRDIGKDSVTDLIGDVVVYKSAEEFKTKPPVCLGVLPLTAVNKEFEPTKDLREALHANLAPTGILLVPLQQIDQNIKQNSNEINNLKKVSISTGCDTLMSGEITERQTRFFGVYSEIKIAANVHITRVSTGAVIWRGKHKAVTRVGSLPIDPISLIGGTISASMNLQDEQYTRTTNDLARRLITAIPNLKYVDKDSDLMTRLEADSKAAVKLKSNQQKSIQNAATFKDCPECPVMVVIPAGSFFMGSPSDHEALFSNEKSMAIGEDNNKPQHRVSIQSFAMGKYEVTQEQWHAVMGNNPSSHKGRKLPVENVSWDDALLFVQKLSQITGSKYRLPAEAEWEYAARAGSTTIYPWGNNDSEQHKYAWFNAIADASNPVGLKNPNQFGLYDMMGNVWEWTQDCWNKNYNGSPTDGSAWTSGDCGVRVVKGGSWSSNTNDLRTAYRLRNSAKGRYDHFGFRVAKALP